MTEPLAATCRWATCATPLGTLALVASSVGLTHVLWEEDDAPPPRLRGRSAVLDEARRQLDHYFAGRLREFDLPLDLAGTEFQLRAWRALGTVPFGETTTYGEQARRLGRPKAARAIGAANGSNPVPIVLPCHRLVGADGSLVAFGSGLQRKAWLLAHEARFARAAIFVHHLTIS